MNTIILRNGCKKRRYKGIHDVKKRAWMHAAATGAKAPGQVATTCMPDGVKWQKILSHIM